LGGWEEEEESRRAGTDSPLGCDNSDMSKLRSASSGKMMKRGGH